MIWHGFAFWLLWWQWNWAKTMLKICWCEASRSFATMSLSSAPVSVNESIGKEDNAMRHGPVNLDQMHEEEETRASRRESGPVCVKESGPTDVDDCISKRSSRSSSQDDFGSWSFDGARLLWAEDEDEFDGCLVGHEEGFELTFETNVASLFPPRADEMFSPSRTQVAACSPTDQLRASQSLKSALFECWGACHWM